MTHQQLKRYGAALIGLAVMSACAVAPTSTLPPTTQVTQATSANAPDDYRAATITRMQGVWKGSFRRYDAAGVLTETLPSEIEVRFSTDEKATYQQTNLLTLSNGTVQKIESSGVWDGRVLRFSNARIDGWFAEVEADPTGLNGVLFIAYKDGSGLSMSEIITVSTDGGSRLRAAQYSIGGKLVRRTLIEETRTSR